jgi:hypothetical protein
MNPHVFSKRFDTLRLGDELKTDNNNDRGIMNLRKGNIMKDLLLVVGIVVVWFALNAWVLPRFGVQT